MLVLPPPSRDGATPAPTQVRLQLEGASADPRVAGVAGLDERPGGVLTAGTAVFTYGP